MVRHVLVPMDASSKSRTALDFALREHGDEWITVLHVTNPLEDAYFASEEDFYTRMDVLEGEGRAEAERIFESARELADEYEVDIETDTALGSPSTSIVEYAEEARIDQIIMGSHGRSGVARLLLGSVAEKVIRRSPVPVTIVK